MLEIIRNTMFIYLIIISSITDIKEGIVKNNVTIPSLLIGLILGLSTGELTVIRDSLFGGLIPFVLLFPLFAAGVLGAGDIKLLCGLGGLMGLDFILNCMLYAFIIGGIMALVLMIYRKNLRRRLSYLYNYLTAFFLYRSTQLYSKNRDGEDKLPLALAIGLGAVVTVIVKQ